MPDQPAEDQGSALDGVVASARRLGVELDEQEAAQWVEALQAESAGGDIVLDVDSGVYGHRVSMLDFTPRDLARFRKIGQIVEMPDRPPAVRTALALSGSAAQSKIQAFPGDCDFFERVHIVAPTREAACAILADCIREKALGTRIGPTFRLIEVKFGSWPAGLERNGEAVAAGSPVSWTPDEVGAGRMAVVRDGHPGSFTWQDAAGDPGWCKLDWLVADPERRGLSYASNVLDVTWEAPDGTITSLDGFIDPYFQEVYLEADSLPLFRRIVDELSTDAVDDYVDQLQGEIRKYTTVHPNYGKVARRLYNVFRLTGRYTEAAYLRELFDEPTTVLYQVASLIQALDEADRPGSTFDPEVLVSQADALIMSAVAALEGQAEAVMVAQLLAVRDSLSRRDAAAERSAEVGGVTDDALHAMNDYFERRLRAVPSIASYLDGIAAGE